MNYRAVACLLLVVSLLPVAGCDKATPVAPTGSILTISANPTRIALNGQSTITIVGRKPDGNPLNPGTEIQLSATLGSVPAIVSTDRNGSATAVFQSDGRLGTATITASIPGSGSTSSGGSTGGSGGSTGGSGGGSGSGSGTGSASLQIDVGAVAGSIILQPTPTTLPSTGGTVRLLAVVRDASGAPLAGQAVNFTSDYGTLNSRGGTVTTDANGEAHDRLTLTETDLLNNVATVNVTAQTVGGGSTGGTSLLSTTAMIHIQTTAPVAGFKYQKGSSPNSVLFTNTTTGSGPFTYTWDFGDGQSSSDASPQHLYSAPGQYTVILSVTSSGGLSDTATAQITVPVTAPGTGS
jgi:PKD domain-containing protein/Big-like domain-containing protein/invasin-like protein